MKSRKNALSPKKHTKSRKEYVDYDYADVLSEEEKEWLGRFTDEFYGASWDLNAVFVLLKDIQDEKLLDIIKDNTIHSTDLGKMVQVYGNTEKGQKNLDLRKIRSIEKFYPTKSGTLNNGVRFKYTKNNIHNPLLDEHRLSCVANVRANRNDLFANQKKNLLYSNEENIEEHIDNFSVENESYILSPEELFIRAINEEIEED
jgi:hypothetical protein